MNDLSFLLELVDPIILGICLCVGFVLKQAFVWFDNRYIPLSALVLGSVLSVIMYYPSINAAVILGGMISGLASTGLYEMLRNLLSKDGSKEE